MPKQDFRDAVRAALREVPLERRKTWDESDLSQWFFAERSKIGALQRSDGDGDPWQHLKSMCSDLIGDKASQ
jgi:hypothetical protein